MVKAVFQNRKWGRRGEGGGGEAGTEEGRRGVSHPCGSVWSSFDQWL